MSTLSVFYNQGWPPKPTFTEKELGDLSGKVIPQNPYFHLRLQIPFQYTNYSPLSGLHHNWRLLWYRLRAL